MKQKAQSYCDTFRQRGVELIDQTYNEWFLHKFRLNRKLSFETSLEKLNPRALEIDELEHRQNNK